MGACQPKPRASDPVVALVAAEKDQQPEGGAPLRRDKAISVDDSDDSEIDDSKEEPILITLTENSRNFLVNLAGFLDSKHVLDTTADRVLPNRWMDKHASFANQEAMVQKNALGQKVKNLEELFDVARLAKPKFDVLMTEIVEKSGLVPTEEVKVNGEVLMDGKMVFKILMLAPLKGATRCLEKVQNEYGNDYSKLIDVVRCSIIVFTEEQLEVVANQLSAEKAHDGYVVVRLKNRIKVPLFNGYRDALYSISIDCGEGVHHVCEIQLHLAPIIALKHTSHIYYEYFRSYFNGSGVEESRMKLLMQVRTYGMDIDEVIACILREVDFETIEILADLVEMMGDVQVTAAVYKRLLQLDQSVALKSHAAIAFQNQGKLAEAEKLLREVLRRYRDELGTTHVGTLAALNNLGLVLSAQGELKEAEALTQEYLIALQQLYGDSHPETLKALHNLGSLYYKTGKFAEAKKIHASLLATRKQQLGNSHPDTINSVNELALTLQATNQLVEAEALFVEGLANRRAQFGADHPTTLLSQNNLAMCLKARGKLDEAEKLFRETFELMRKQLGESHPSTLISCNNLATVLKAQKKIPEAEELYRKAVELSRLQLGDTNPNTLTAISNLGLLLKQQNKFVEAEVLSRECLIARRNKLGNEHPDTLTSMTNLAMLLKAQKKFTEAENLMSEVVKIKRKHLGDSDLSTVSSIAGLGVLKQILGELDEAEELLVEAFEARKEFLGDAHPDTKAVASALAENDRLKEVRAR